MSTLRDLTITHSSLVKRGADPDAHIRLTKTASPETEKPVPATIEESLAALAKSIQRRDPSLTPEQAYQRAVETPAGRRVYGEIDQHPSAAPVNKAAPVLKADFAAARERIAKARPSLTDEQVYAEALRTPEGQAAYAAGLA